jgi:amino acid permease
MDKVLFRSSLTAVFIYVVVGCFGYLTFAMSEEQTHDQLWASKRSKDILEADYGDEAGLLIKFCLFSVLITVICATPIALLPAKESFFSLITNKPAN